MPSGYSKYNQSGWKHLKKSKIKMSVNRSGTFISDIQKKAISEYQKGRKKSIVTKNRMSISASALNRKGSQSHLWKGGRRITNGYIYLWTPNGFKREHRLIMEKQIGRKLSKKESVHHINGIRSDNKLKNLIIMDASKHAAYHNSKRS